MNIKQFFKRLLTDTSVYFTLLAAAYSALMLVVNVTEDEVLLSAARLLFLFLFAVLAALGRSVLRARQLPRGVRVLAHYGALLLAFYLCLLLPAGMRAAQVLVGLVLFTVLYFIVAGIAALFLARFRANQPEEAHYESQFKKNR